MANQIENIVVLFDGTANSKNILSEKTNVAKFHDILNKTQVKCFYIPGIGELLGESILDEAIGSKIQERLLHAFRFVTRATNNIKRRGNNPHLYFSGFSRGAYIARTLCWLLYHSGIPENSNDCEMLQQLFIEKKYEKLNEYKNQNTTLTRIEWLGLWDTVKAAYFEDYNDNEVCPIVKTIFHAMAMDELRGKFQVTKFSQNCGKVHNCWFPGNHCDIGGGYPDGTLANSSFVWMLKSAELNGLFLPEHWEQEFPENINGEIHDETQNSPWKFMEKIPRKLEGEPVFHTALRTEYKTKALHSLPLNEYQILS